MSALKYKDTDGTWKEVTSLNQVVTIAKKEEVVVTDMSNLEWREIEVPVYASKNLPGAYYVVCSAANINLREHDNWILCASSKNIDSYYKNLYPADSKPLIVSPIIAKLKGENATNPFKRVGIYTYDVSRLGFGGFGSDFYVEAGYAVTMDEGVNTLSYNRVHDTQIFIDATLDSTAKLIYLADKGGLT